MPKWMKPILAGSSLAMLEKSGAPARDAENAGSTQPDRQNTPSSDPHEMILTISAHSHGNMIDIQVVDTGSGIAPENMDKIFEPLYTTKLKGIGLGLAVSQKLVEANDGSIEVVSRLGKGTTFIVFLPKSRPSPDSEIGVAPKK